MEPYSEVKQHAESNLTLLCDAHHREATNGLLTSEQIAVANVTPANFVSGISRPFALHFAGTELRVEVGSNLFSGGAPHQDGGIAFIPISVDDTDLLWFRIDDDGRIFLHVNILDECNLPLLAIVENALMFRADTWDIEFKGKVLTLRQKPRDIFLEIEFCPPGFIRILRGRLLCNGIELLVQKSHVFIVNSGIVFRECHIHGGIIGLQLGRNERGYSCCVRAEPQELKRYDVDRKKQMRNHQRVVKMMRPFRESDTGE